MLCGTAFAAVDGGELGMEGHSTSSRELEQLEASAIHAQDGADGRRGQD
jgi:hypothetical protein